MLSLKYGIVKKETISPPFGSNSGYNAVKTTETVHRVGTFELGFGKALDSMNKYSRDRFQTKYH